MATDLTVPKGDYGYYLNFTVTDSTGTAFNLTGYTTKFKVWVGGIPGTIVVNGTCVDVVPANGTCRYLVVSTDFITVASYVWELEMTKADVVESTKKYTLDVVESG